MHFSRLIGRPRLRETGLSGWRANRRLCGYVLWPRRLRKDRSFLWERKMRVTLVSVSPVGAAGFSDLSEKIRRGLIPNRRTPPPPFRRAFFRKTAPRMDQD